ncbi:hypothetical protein C6503_09110 [Candidatus Poribacteria bacterium]|nr:MAG: hypothetical protein C6503_09110 [Candidatus Poribacteria bacterium]
MFERENQTLVVCVLYLIACLLPSASAQTDEIVDTYPQWELPNAAKARLGKGDINAIQFSPDGTLLAVGTDIGVWLYDVKTGEEISLFAGICESLAFSPDGRFLANRSGDYFYNLGESRWAKKVELWEVATGQEVPFPDMPSAAAVLCFSEDGKTLISLRKSRDIISRLDIETGKQTFNKLGKRPGYVHREVYALRSDKIAIGMPNGNIELWDTTTGKRLSTLRENVKKLEVPDELVGLIDDENSVFALTFSPDGTRLASANRDTTVQLWDITNKTEPITLRRHTNEPTELAFSPDGKMLASGGADKRVQLCDTTTGKPIGTCTGHVSDIRALAFSPDGKMLASGSSDGTIRFWNTQTAEPLPTRITGHIASLKAATFLKDSATIASVGYNGIITLWNLKTFQKTTLQTKRTLEIIGFRDWYLDLALSSDGTKLVSFGTESTLPEPWSDSVLRLTDVSTGRELMSVPGSASDLTFSPDAKTVAGTRSDTIRLWNTETGKTFNISLLDTNTDPEEQHRPSIRTLEFSPDGRKLAGGTMGGGVQMWDTETGEALTSFFAEEPPTGNRYRDPIMDVAFSSDGSLLAVGSMKKLRLLGNRRQLGFKEISYGPEVWGNRLLFSPDDTVLVIGLIQSGGIELWDLATGERLTTLDGHTNRVQTLAFSPDGKMLVSAGGDGTVLLWDWDEVLTTAYNRESNAEASNKAQRSETVLKFTERSAETEANARYISTVEQTYLENRWKNIVEAFTNDPNTTMLGYVERRLFSQITQIGRTAKDKESYMDRLHKLMDTVPDNLSVRLNIHLALAAFYRENDMSEEAAAHIQKTGFITEEAWLILGPFDNAGGIGYNTAYIPEDAAQIDTTKTYESIDRQVRWQKSTDDIRNAHINLGEDVNWGVAYAFATVISPDERKVQFRFDSDDQGKIWLNGKQVFTHTKAFTAEIDKYTIPVTFKSGQNSILVKVCEEVGGWGFYLRITDTNGEPFDDLKISQLEETGLAQ